MIQKGLWYRIETYGEAFDRTEIMWLDNDCIVIKSETRGKTDAYVYKRIP